MEGLEEGMTALRRELRGGLSGLRAGHPNAGSNLLWLVTEDERDQAADPGLAQSPPLQGLINGGPVVV